jgi:IMP dehydrogenase
MPYTNGGVSGNRAHLPLSEEIMDFRKAQDVLKSNYESADGLDAKSLLDSRTNGGLTYNDFLILPGYVGMCLVHLGILSP